MSFRCIRLLKTIRNSCLTRHNVYSTNIAAPIVDKNNKHKEYRKKADLLFTEDPDTFGTLSRRLNRDKVVLEDEGDLKEEVHVKTAPLPIQQLTTKQYADIIKQFLKHKRIKEALNVLEVRMLKEDRVKPENYIYNILIGACADVGFTKKAFSLYNDMKKRALKATGDTYTCLFHACSNSPFLSDGLKKASNLRELLKEKGIELNLTNYNAMIKAFGRCGDLPTAFKIVDEMMSKNIKIRVHTFNHLLQACITDKENGLRHALIVWRKMLTMREKPNIYSFNLMLKCVKECNMGSKADIEELIGMLQNQIALESEKKYLQIEQAKPAIASSLEKQSLIHSNFKSNLSDLQFTQNDAGDIANYQDFRTDSAFSKHSQFPSNLSLENKLAVTPSRSISVQIVTKNTPVEVRIVPNLLSKQLQIDQVLSLKEVTTVQEKFAVIGGQEDFLKEMKEYSVKPDIKTFTQMLLILDDSIEAENKLLQTIEAQGLNADIDFYNMLIKKRCLRSDYEAALDVKNIIIQESKRRKKKYPLKKKLRLKTNIMTYGVLAMACTTKDSGNKLLSDMKEDQIKVNIAILGTLLRQGTSHCDFGYVLNIMKIAKDENIQVNHIFLKHLEGFKEKCWKIIQSKKIVRGPFLESYRIFSKTYTDWLNEINPEDALKSEHPWAQFNETHPETFQRQPIKIEEPKKFYKRSRKYIKYVPTL